LNRLCFNWFGVPHVAGDLFECVISYPDQPNQPKSMSLISRLTFEWVISQRDRRYLVVIIFFEYALFWRSDRMMEDSNKEVSPPKLDEGAACEDGAATLWVRLYPEILSYAPLYSLS
jgi:hypothetical protein